MADEILITEETLAEHPEWTAKDLKVGDPVPAVEITTEPIVTTRSRASKTESPTVEVDREMLEGILKEVGELRDKVNKVDQLEKDNAMLLEVADKSRISSYQAKQIGVNLIRTARVWTWQDKIVKATVTVRNEAFTDNIGRVHTDQVLNVIMEDGTEIELPYDRFAKEKGLVEAEIIGRNTNDVSGQTFFKMKMKDGKEIEINYLFLN